MDGPEDSRRDTLWRRIHDDLLADIRAGNYSPGDRLPTEAELGRRFGVNRHTVRRALAELREADIIHVRRGSGAFVAQKQVGYEIGPRTRFSQNITAIGREPTHAVLRVETVRAGNRERGPLELDSEAMVHVIETLNSADDTPIVYARHSFPADRMPDFPAHIRETQSVTEAFRRSGIPDYVRAWTRLIADRPGPMIAQHLRMSEGRPCLRTESLNLDPQGRPVQYGHSWFCSDRVQLVVDRASFSGDIVPDGEPV